MDTDHPKFRIGYPKISPPKLKPRGIQILKILGVEVFDSITPLAIFVKKNILSVNCVVGHLAVGVTKILVLVQRTGISICI